MHLFTPTFYVTHFLSFNLSFLPLNNHLFLKSVIEATFCWHWCPGPIITRKNLLTAISDFWLIDYSNISIINRIVYGGNLKRIFNFCKVLGLKRSSNLSFWCPLGGFDKKLGDFFLNRLVALSLSKIRMFAACRPCPLVIIINLSSIIWMIWFEVVILKFRSIVRSFFHQLVLSAFYLATASFFLKVTFYSLPPLFK